MQDGFGKNKFEKDWQTAFENAELSPWATNWETIKNELNAIKEEKKKRGLVLFWRYSAAACALLALGLYSSGIFNYSKNQVATIISNKVDTISNHNVLSTAKTDPHKEKTDNLTMNNESPEKGKINSLPGQPQKSHLNPGQNRFITKEKYISLINSEKRGNKKSMDKNNFSSSLTFENKKSKQNAKADKTIFQIKQNENIDKLGAILSLNKSTNEIIFKTKLLPVKANYLAINDLPEEEVEKNKKNKDKWSVDLAFAPGSYIPNIQSHKALEYTSTMQTAMVSKQHASLTSNFIPPNRNIIDATSHSVDTELSNTKPAFSYQANLGAGYAINNKVSLSLGLQYLYQNSQINTTQYFNNDFSGERTTYITDVVSESLKSKNLDQLNDFSISSRISGIANSNLQINNTYRYISAPVMVHYKILNKKFGLSAGTGFSADMFINNQVGNEKEGVAIQTFTAENSIYKKMAYSGLINLRLDYKLFKKYSFFLEPGFRTALGSFTKSSGVSSYPSSFNVGTGLRYQF